MKVDQITFLASPTSREQAQLFAVAAEGVQKYGVDACVKTSSHSKTKAVACWGWRKGQELRRMGHEVLVFERAYLGDRFKWTSIAWNGLNGHGDFCLPADVTGERFEKHFEPLKPWREDGDYILIMGQVPGDMSLRGQDMTAFYESAAAVLSRKHNKPAFFRPHPHAKHGNFKPDIKTLENGLEEALQGAFLTVAYNSNSSVDAIVRGVPSLAVDKGSMAWAVTSHSFDGSIRRTDRTAWAARLAHCQFLREEISRGEWWERYADRKA
jgi:hypothetical protein